MSWSFSSTDFGGDQPGRAERRGAAEDGPGAPAHALADDACGVRERHDGGPRGEQALFMTAKALAVSLRIGFRKGEGR